jgi:hypothetical protein
MSESSDRGVLVWICTLTISYWEAEKDGLVQRTWCYVDQPLDGLRWFGKDANDTWPREVIE